jgi:MTH538 TIR-like domain (DUF1863).
MNKKINVFVSHYGGDEEYISKFKSLLLRQNYEVRDGSIVESEPNKANNKEYIKSLIRKQIDWAGKIIVLIGPRTAEREWVNWEIEYAAHSGDKRIIGVYLQGATYADLPAALSEYGDALVAWNSDKVSAAIEGENIWQDCDGNTRPPIDSPRSTC